MTIRSLQTFLLVSLGAMPLSALSAHHPFHSQVEVMEAPKSETSKPDLKKFLLSIKGSYGWNPVKGTISYDFFPDGRVHIQGPDGEATMWEGKWSLQGDQLTIVNTTERKTKTVTAKIVGNHLLLDGHEYRRALPD